MYPIPMPASFFLFESYAKKNYNKKKFKNQEVKEKNFEIPESFTEWGWGETRPEY